MLHRGDRLRFQGDTYTVLGVVGTLVRLALEFRRGADLAIHVTDLVSDPGVRDRGRCESGGAAGVGLDGRVA
jgi:hypothetical protein